MHKMEKIFKVALTALLFIGLATVFIVDKNGMDFGAFLYFDVRVLLVSLALLITAFVLGDI